MKILVVGKGGREHALVRAFSESPSKPELFCFPGSDAIFELATELNLPIYLETAMERTKVAYERYGFETFHYWEDPSGNIKFWFMKWDPSKQP